MNSSRVLGAAILGLTVVLAIIILLPAVSTPGGRYTACGPQRCTNVIEYGSVSFEYGGFGAVYQSGVNTYSIEEWVCSCSAFVEGSKVSCCVPPLAGPIWAAVGALVLADASTALYLGISRFGRRRCMKSEDQHGTPYPAGVRGDGVRSFLEAIESSVVLRTHFEASFWKLELSTGEMIPISGRSAVKK